MKPIAIFIQARRSGMVTIGAYAALVAVVLPNADWAAEESSRLDSDGTIHVREFTLPPSELWSPEFARYHLEQTKKLAKGRAPAPSRSAPKAEWDKYDAIEDAETVKLLDKTRAVYSVEIERTTFAGVPVAIVTPKGGVAPSRVLKKAAIR